MTEQEAKTKECPKHLIVVAIMQAAAIQKGASDKIIDEISNLGYCTASKCGMWKETTVLSQTKDDYCYVYKVTGGHCGLVK